MPVPAAAFKPWSGGAAGVVVADLGKLGVTTAALGGMETGNNTMTFGSCQHDKAELFYGGKAMVLARYPNVAPDGSWRFLYGDLPAGEGGGTCPSRHSHHSRPVRLSSAGPNESLASLQEPPVRQGS